MWHETASVATDAQSWNECWLLHLHIFFVEILFLETN